MEAPITLPQAGAPCTQAVLVASCASPTQTPTPRLCRLPSYPSPAITSLLKTSGGPRRWLSDCPLSGVWEQRGCSLPGKRVKPRPGVQGPWFPLTSRQALLVLRTLAGGTLLSARMPGGAPLARSPSV